MMINWGNMLDWSPSMQSRCCIWKCYRLQKALKLYTTLSLKHRQPTALLRYSNENWTYVQWTATIVWDVSTQRVQTDIECQALKKNTHLWHMTLHDMFKQSSMKPGFRPKNYTLIRDAYLSWRLLYMPITRRKLVHYNRPLRLGHCDSC